MGATEKERQWLHGNRAEGDAILIPTPTSHQETDAGDAPNRLFRHWLHENRGGTMSIWHLHWKLDGWKQGASHVHAHPARMETLEAFLIANRQQVSASRRDQ